jgi:hypothetical protein
LALQQLKTVALDITMIALDITMTLSARQLIHQGGLRGRRAHTHTRTHARKRTRSIFELTCNFSLLYTILKISSIVNPLKPLFADSTQKGIRPGKNQSAECSVVRATLLLDTTHEMPHNQDIMNDTTKFAHWDLNEGVDIPDFSISAWHEQITTDS